MPSLFCTLVSILRIGHWWFRTATQRPYILRWVNLEESSALFTECAGTRTQRGLRYIARKEDTWGRLRINSRVGPCACEEGTKATTSGVVGVIVVRFMCICSLFLSPLHPSQAIRELQEEVSRLRLRLEDSLHQPPQGSPTRPPSTLDRPARARDRPADAPAAWGSHCGRWVTTKLLPCARGR